MIITESNQGGGLHGRATVEIKDAFFKQVKNSLNQKGYGQAATELHYCDLTNLTGGTSFGALSTIALCRIDGRNGGNPYFSSPGEFGLYIDKNAARIFPHNNGFFKTLFNDPRQLLQGLKWATQYSNKGLKSVLNDVIGPDAHFSDVRNDVIITMSTTEFLQGQDKAARVDVARFAKSHVARGEGTLINDPTESLRKNWVLSEVVMASASPASYLPGVALTNPNRDDYIIAQDGGFSGFNNPSIPVLNEASFIYGSECSVEKASVIELGERQQVVKAYSLPKDLAHLHWGTGDFSTQNVSRTRKDALENTVLSMGVGSLISAPINGVHQYSLRTGAAAMEHYHNFDFNVAAAPKQMHPDSDFTLSTPNQLSKLKDIGQWAADQLSTQIAQVADLVADAYIDRLTYEKNNTSQLEYKNFLKQQSCDL